MAEETKEIKLEDVVIDRQPYEHAVTNMISNPKYRSNYMFYAYMVAQCQPTFDVRMQAPAAVYFFRDHYVIKINPLLFNEFPLNERLGVIKHEMLHVMNGHIGRLEHRDMRKFNYATDCAINQLINREDLPKGCVFPETLPTTLKTVPTMKTAEQYYDIIDMEDDDQQNGQGNGVGDVLDDHSAWEESEGDADLQKDITKGMLDKSTNETQKARGNLPSNLDELLSLFSRSKEVDWKKVLRKIVGNKKANSRRTLMRSDRRFPKREDLKGKTKDRTFELAIVGDESGSVSNEELVQALSEAKNICDMTGTALWYVPVDTQAHTPKLLTKTDRTFNRSACGGTILEPAVAALKDNNIHYNALVVITDGYIDHSDITAFERTGKKVIWLITSQGRIDPAMKYGKMQAFQLKGKSNG